MDLAAGKDADHVGHGQGENTKTGGVRLVDKRLTSVFEAVKEENDVCVGVDRVGGLEVSGPLSTTEELTDVDAVGEV